MGKKVEGRRSTEVWGEVLGEGREGNGRLERVSPTISPSRVCSWCGDFCSVRDLTATGFSKRSIFGSSAFLRHGKVHFGMVLSQSRMGVAIFVDVSSLARYSGNMRSMNLVNHPLSFTKRSLAGKHLT